MFYTIRQNNSGGYFIENERVGKYVIVEAGNDIEAESKLRDIVSPYSEYCPCCGERWDFYFNNDDGKEVPMIYDTPIDEYTGRWDEKIIIYYSNGKKEIIEF
jgi:hypothetical protein